jgi:hypothetical protein
MGNEPDTYRRHWAPDRLNLSADFCSRCRNAGSMSAFGTKRTFTPQPKMSAFGE